MKSLVVVLVLAIAGAASAQEASKRPVGRPGATVNGTVDVRIDTSGSIHQPARSPEATALVDRTQSQLAQSLRPEPRPRRIERAGREQQQVRAKGAVCGDPDIQGELIGRVKGEMEACGLTAAVRVRSVSGIALSQRSVMDCPTAAALKSWIETTAKPTLRREGGGLKSLRVAAHYACRGRNNQPDAVVSEHGRGKAIDISAVVLRDGSQISVLKGWDARETSKLMRRLHAEACGPFGTVLGPEADRHHKDHMHFDTANHGNGPYCR
jgi:hypothetical protein